MKKLQMLTAAAGVLLALAGPTLAASRNQSGVDAYATSDRSGAYNYGPVSGEGRNANARAFEPAQRQYQTQYGTGGNLPYPDRPYGDPDRW